MQAANEWANYCLYFLSLFLRMFREYKPYMIRGQGLVLLDLAYLYTETAQFPHSILAKGSFTHMA